MCPCVCEIMCACVKRLSTTATWRAGRFYDFFFHLPSLLEYRKIWYRSDSWNSEFSLQAQIRCSTRNFHAYVLTIINTFNTHACYLHFLKLLLTVQFMQICFPDKVPQLFQLLPTFCTKSKQAEESTSTYGAVSFTFIHRHCWLLSKHKS